MRVFFTHFATADEEDAHYFHEQLTRFKEWLDRLPKLPVGYMQVIQLQVSGMQYGVLHGSIRDVLYGLNLVDVP